MGYVEPARQFALEKCSYDWILFLDGDERLPIKLKNKLIDIANNDMADVVAIKRIDYDYGEPLYDWALTYDNYDFQLRFFKKNHMEFNKKIHDPFEVQPGSRILKIKDKDKSIIHLKSYDFEDDLIKLNNYSTVELKNLIDSYKKNQTKRYMLSFLLSFMKEFILILLKKDRGNDILRIAYMLHYYALIRTKILLYNKYGNLNFSNEILKQYKKISKDIVSQHQENSGN